MLHIASLKRTCIACPSQWEGVLEDSRPIYIRFRWGELSVRLGEIGLGVESAIDAPDCFEWEADGGIDGYITIDQVCGVAGLRIPAGYSEPAPDFAF